jgi:ABC-2 type transport system ATP-binding protein
VISTHQVQDIEKLIEHVLILEDSRLLLDASADEICRKLYFANGVSRIDTNEAIYVSPTLQGYNALLANPNEEECTLNLETLFNGVLANQERIAALFEKEESLV